MVAGLAAADEMRAVPRRALCPPFFTSHLTLTWLFPPANSSRLPFVTWGVLASPEAFLGSTPQISLARPLPQHSWCSLAFLSISGPFSTAPGALLGPCCVVTFTLWPAHLLSRLCDELITGPVEVCVPPQYWPCFPRPTVTPCGSPRTEPACPCGLGSISPAGLPLCFLHLQMHLPPWMGVISLPPANVVCPSSSCDSVLELCLVRWALRTPQTWWLLSALEVGHPGSRCGQIWGSAEASSWFMDGVFSPCHHMEERLWALGSL